MDLTTWDRCITLGPVGSVLPFAYNNGQQIVQGPGYVVFRNEMIHEARVIPLDGRPHASPEIRTWMGDSRGHWEGNTLVVETTNFNGQVFIGAQGGGFGDSGAVATDQLRLVERFTRVDEDTINYEITVNDPQTWTQAVEDRDAAAARGQLRPHLRIRVPRRQYLYARRASGRACR